MEPDFKKHMKSNFFLFGALVLSATSAFAQFPLVAPAFSGSGLGFTGHPDNGYGIVGYSTTGDFAPDRGHSVGGVVLNAPNYQPVFDVRAHYYIAGMQDSPFTKVGPKIATAHATTPVNLSNLATFVANNINVGYSDIRFNFGANNPAAPTTTWNLGADVQGSDWTGSMASPVEQRIYRGDPSEVGSSLYFQDTQIIVFGYSALYETVNYGATTGGGDDVISAYSDAVTATMVGGLAGDALGLAEALMADIMAGGGKVQLVFDSIQTITYVTAPELGFIHGNYAFSGTIMVVPEPASSAALLGAAALTGVVMSRRRRRA